MAIVDVSLAPLQALAPELRELIAARVEVRHFPDGGIVFDQDDAAHACYAIVSGSVRFSKRMADGNFALMSFQNASTWFGETSLVDAQPRNLRVTAVGATSVLELDRVAFAELMAGTPAFKSLVLQWLAQKLRNSVNQSYEVLSLPLRVRLARQLLQLAETHGERMGGEMSQGNHAPITLKVKLSQEDLSRLLGATRQRINQLLREWQTDKLIAIKSRTISLLDIERLRAIT